MPSASQNAPGSNLGIDRASNTIRLTRDFDSQRAEIFEAWTKPEHVTRWWDAAGDPLAVCEIDLRPGGSFRFVTRGHPDLPFAGVYREIAPPDRLHAQPSVEGCLKADRATPPSLRPPGQARGVAIQGT